LCSSHPTSTFQLPFPKSRKILIFVTFRGCSKNYEIKDF
jgi:hypothetical protein